MLLLALTLACAPKTATPTEAAAASNTGKAELPDEDASVDWTRVMVQFHMSEHFTRAVAARDAVIDGRLEDAKTDLTWLAEHETFPGVPAEYGAHMADMRAVAATGAHAKDAEGLAACIGGLGVTCAGCHTALHVTPVVPGSTSPAPVNTGGLHGHASRYGWAANQLWIGLVKPNDDSWTAGLAGLHSPAFDPTDLGLADDKLTEVEAYGLVLTGVSEEDVASTDPDGRAELFGRIISSCAGCHAAAMAPAAP